MKTKKTHVSQLWEAMLQDTEVSVKMGLILLGITQNVSYDGKVGCPWIAVVGISFFWMQCFKVHRKWTDIMSLELFFSELVQLLCTLVAQPLSCGCLIYSDTWLLKTGFSPQNSMDPQDSVYRHVACMLLDIYTWPSNLSLPHTFPKKQQPTNPPYEESTASSIWFFFVGA